MYSLFLFSLLTGAAASASAGSTQPPTCSPPGERVSSVWPFCLPDNYDRQVAPTQNRTLPVGLQLTVEDIGSINSKQMSVTLEGLLQLRWTDPRIVVINESDWHNHPILFKSSIFSQLWVPPIFFRRALSFEVIDMPKTCRRTEVFPNRTIVLTTPVIFTISCDFHLQRYPLDNQHCDIVIESYQTDVVLEGVIRYNTTTRHKTIGWIIHMAEVPKDEYNDLANQREYFLPPAKKNSSNGDNPKYSLFGIRITLHRMRMGYFVRTYLPTILLVVVSWSTFFLHPFKLTATRLFMSLGATLAIIKILNRIEAPTEHITAIECYVVTSLALTVLTVFELAFVLLDKTKVGRFWRQLRRKQGTDEFDEDEIEVDDKVKEKTPAGFWPKVRRALIGEHVDTTAAVVAPLVFGAFNIAYWIIYLT